MTGLSSWHLGTEAQMSREPCSNLLVQLSKHLAALQAEVRVCGANPVRGSEFLIPIVTFLWVVPSPEMASGWCHPRNDILDL